MTDVHNLHDRATRGELLSGEDQVRLNDWYKQRDVEELAQLNGDAASLTDRKLIQEQINATIVRIQSVTAQIQSTLDENESLHSLTQHFIGKGQSRA